MKDLKTPAICAAWIGGLLLGGWLLFFFTANLRETALMRQVNRILTARGESFTLTGIYDQRNRRLPLGTAFQAGEGTLLVFPLVSAGASLSCGALIDAQGQVERIIPLGIHSEQAFERLPQGILDVYIRRIEGEGR
jgi:hypothetical protein